MPAIRQVCHAEQIDFGTLSAVKELRERSRSVKTFELAVRKCHSLNTAAIFMGPREHGELHKGDDVEQFVQESIDVSDPKSDTEPDDSDGDPESEPESDPDGWADELIAEVEVLSPNTHVDIIRALIARNGLHYQGAPISPGTGGLNGRTKFDMLQEVRQAVGAAPLPDSALRGKRSKPDVPMGKPVTKSPGRRINFGSPARPEPVIGQPSCGFMWLLPVMLAQLFMVGLSMHANGNFVSCRTISPSWVSAPRSATPTPRTRSRPTRSRPSSATSTSPATTDSRGSQARHRVKKSATRTWPASLARKPARKSSLASTCSSQPWCASFYYCTPSASRSNLRNPG